VEWLLYSRAGTLASTRPLFTNLSSLAAAAVGDPPIPPARQSWAAVLTRLATDLNAPTSPPVGPSPPADPNPFSIGRDPSLSEGGGEAVGVWLVLPPLLYDLGPPEPGMHSPLETHLAEYCSSVTGGGGVEGSGPFSDVCLRALLAPARALLASPPSTRRPGGSGGSGREVRLLFLHRGRFAEAWLPLGDSVKALEALHSQACSRMGDDYFNRGGYCRVLLQAAREVCASEHRRLGLAEPSRYSPPGPVDLAVGAGGEGGRAQGEGERGVARVYGFWHTGLIGPWWRDILDEQHDAIVASGLLNRSQAIELTLLGTAATAATVTSLAPMINVSYGGGLSLFEFPSLARLQARCRQDPSAYVWYMHNKGSSIPARAPSAYLPTAHWRRYMQEFVIWRHRECILALDQGAKACGAQLDKDYGSYSGNFW
jgi:hypothetical protein